MITGRRSQDFHQVVEGASTGGAHASTYAALVDVVDALRVVPAPVADADFVARLRERLLTEAATVLLPTARPAVDDRLRLRPSTPQARRRNRRLAAAVSGAALIGATATMALAAQSALPGEGLYPVKRTIENAHAQLTLNQADQGRVVLSSASTRLDEVTQLSRENADPALIAHTLNSFTDEAISGSDLLVNDYQATGDQSSITAVRTFTATSMTRLHDLQGSIPSSSDDQLLQAAQALDQIQQVSVRTCSGCAGPLVTQVPTVLTQALDATTANILTTSTANHHDGSQTGLGGPVIPDLGGNLPPASVTNPDGTDGSTTATTTDVRSTLDNLTSNLTSGNQDPTTSTVTNTTANLLDAVGQAGNTAGNTVGTVVGQVTGDLPTGLPVSEPTTLPTGLSSDLPSGLPTLP
jgi:hypothetical protein